ncbi:MAG: hypothetical protein J5563_05920 [Clostridia bacterium]|nr:hypothetical protein [Clostridia bacterium]
METKAKTKTTAKTKTETSLFERLRSSAKVMREKLLNAITLAGRLISDVRGEWRIPDDVIRDLARLFLPSVLEMYETEEGRATLAAWAEKSKDNCSGGTDRKDGKRDGATAGGKE